MNLEAKVVKISIYGDFIAMADKEMIVHKKRLLVSTSDKVVSIVILLISIYICITLVNYIHGIDYDFAVFSNFSTIFVSLIFQSFPFLVGGILLSSIIQIFISEERIANYFPKNKVLAFGTAIVSGFFLPLCDCAVVPVTARLIKKGIPASVAVTFMLVSPIINPITIFATFYAFPQQTNIVLYRIYLGVSIALIVGVTWMLFPEKSTVLLQKKLYNHCECGHCDHESEKKMDLKDKILSILKHSSDEFMNVGRFFMLGAFISSVIQVIVQKELFVGISGFPVISVLVMMLVAFLMSVCSTADAFIAKSFFTFIPIHGVISFMVFGPLLDIKNVLMMSGYFKRSFILKTCLLLVVFGFLLIGVFTKFIFG